MFEKKEVRKMSNESESFEEKKIKKALRAIEEIKIRLKFIETLLASLDVERRQLELLREEEEKGEGGGY